MLMVIVLAAAILLTMAFCLKNKRLHLFEILTVWLVILSTSFDICCGRMARSLSLFLAPNEWFILLGLLIEYAVVIYLPKRLPKSVSALMMLLGMALPLSLDHSIGVPPFDVYDTNIKPQITFSDMLTWLMYPPFNLV